MSEQRSKKLEQIRKLLDKASDPGVTPSEAEALRQKADDLMLAYTISEFEVQARKPKNERERPTKKFIPVCGDNHPLKTQLVALFGMIVDHSRCKAVYSGLRDQKSGVTSTVIGFPSDLEYVEMLFTSLQVQMARELEPKPNPLFTEAENLTLLKEAGLKWVRIHELLYPDVPWERRHGVRYTKVYTDYCKLTGRNRMYSSPITYQRNFAEGFAERVAVRLYEMRKVQQASPEGSGMELALRDLKAEVLDAFNEEYGRTKSVTLAGRSKYDHAARARGDDAGRRADLGQTRVGVTRELT